MTLGMSREEWASNAHKIALEQVSLEHSGTRVGDRGDACVTVTGPSSQLNTNRFLTSLGVESLTHALLTDDDNIVQDDASSAALFGALIGRHEDAQNGRALANDVFARILALRAAFRKLRRHANSQGNDDLTKVYTHAESRATEAIVSAVGTLKRRMPAAPAKDDKSNGQLHHATPAAPTNSLAERSSSAVDMNSPEAQMAGGGSAFDLADEATPHLFATVDAARSLRSFSIEPTTSTIIDQSTAEVISMAPLNVVRDYIAHRRTVALWMTNTASRALDDYITEKAVDLETRSTLDTERSKLLGMAEQIDAFIAGQQRERAEMEAERELRNELAAMERFAVAEAIAHEKALNKSLEHEVKELRARLQHLRNMITMGDARSAALAKKQQVLAEEQAAAEQSMASRLKHIDLAIRDGELRQWLTHLSCSFVSDLAAQAAQVNSDVLQRQESRLRALYGKVAESVADAMERSKDLVVRLSQGRNQLADFLGMSPLSTTSTVTDFRGATPVAPVTSMMTESIVSPEVTPGVQTPNASRVFDTANTNNNNSSFSSTDTVACGKDVLKVMSRIASAAEDLWNRLGDLTERWNKEELALGANTDACEKRMEVAYEHITTLIDATRGDVLEAAYGTRLPVTRSLDDVEDQSQAARKPRKGLPLKLARSIKPAVANGTPRHKADNGADATYLPTPPPPPTTSATVVIPRAAISDDTSQPRATWVAFVAQFRSAFGDGFLGF